MKVNNLESLEAYFDGELSTEESSQVESQIQAQPELRKQLDAFKHDSTLIKQFPQVKVPFDLSASILELAGKTEPCPFALADSPISSDILNESVAFSQTQGESETVSISRETENVPYEDDWKPPTIAQRISRALLWPMLVVMIALGMYMADPSKNPVDIKTTPDESELEMVQQDENLTTTPSSDSVSDSQANNNSNCPQVESVQVESVQVESVQVKNLYVSKSEPRITILCKIDAQKFTNEQWYKLLDSFGIVTDKSKDPLEIKAWTVNASANSFKQMVSKLQSVPGIVSIQSENSDLLETLPEKKSTNVAIRIVVDEL